MLFVALVSIVDATGNTVTWFSLVRTLISLSDMVTCTLLTGSSKITVLLSLSPKVFSLLLTSIE